MTARAFISFSITHPSEVRIKGRLPTLLASSVIRGANLGESHGGLYAIDLERGTAVLELDWNRTDIDFSGQGGDRGLRGIAFHGAYILVAANARLWVLDRGFRVVDSFANRYLKHCHEIAVANGRVFLTATGFDSLLAFDLDRRRFAAGWHLDALDGSLRLRGFDPEADSGPAEAHKFHLNSVSASAAGLWFSGLHTPGLMHTDGNVLRMAGELPPGSHNAQVLDDGLLYNDTGAERVCYRRDSRVTAFGVPDFPASDILHRERFSSAVARPRFARGLCALGDGLIAGGSSPSTVSVYDLAREVPVMRVNLSMDVRNAIHGLAVVPADF